MRRERVEYSTAGSAARLAIQRAAEAVVIDRRRDGTELERTLNATELRVLLGVISLTATWSRLEDFVSLHALANEIRLPGKDGADDRQRDRRVRAALNALARAGVVIYRPGGAGRGRMSAVGLPDPRGESEQPLTDDSGGSASNGKGGPHAPQIRGARANGNGERVLPAPEKASREETPGSHPSNARGLGRRRLEGAALAGTEGVSPW